jgi:CRP/FNR family cyclic AMP-dependent transcriptional regulator
VAGDPGDGCYRVEEGLLKVSMVGPGGEERILAILGPGCFVGELSMRNWFA